MRAPGALAEHDRQPAVLHRRVEGLLDRPAEAVDLVDEEDRCRARARSGRRRCRPCARAPGRRSARTAPRARRRRCGRARSCRARAGPASSTWSSGSPRRRAASMKTSSWLGDLLLVDEVVEPRGPQRAVELLVAARRAHRASAPRRDRPSSTASPSDPLGSRGDAHAAPPRPRRCAGPSPISSSGVSPLARRRAAARPRRRVAEAERPVAGERARVVARRPAPAGDALVELAGDLLAQLDDDPLGGPLADPGHGLEALRVAGGDRAQQLARRRRRRATAIATFGPTPDDRDQLQEEVALLLGGEAVERERVVARRPGGRAASPRLPRARDRLAASRPRPRAGSRRRRRRSRRGRGGAPGPRRGPRRSSRHRDRGGAASSALRGAGVARVADRDGERVGGVVGRRAARASPSSAPTIRCTCSLPARAGAADRHLDRLRRVVEAGDRRAGRRPASRRRAPGRRRSPSARSCRSRGPRAPPPPARASAISSLELARGCGASRRSSGAPGGASITPPSSAVICAAGDAHDAEAGVRDARVDAHDEDHRLLILRRAPGCLFRRGLARAGLHRVRSLR